MKRLRLFTFALLWAALLVLACLASELAARAFLAERSGPNLYAFYASRPAAYRNSPYWSPEFLAEMRATAGQWGLSDDLQWTTADYSGRWYNVKDGIRRTTDQPARWQHTIWLYGNSTLYGWEVPDGYTIASYLQRLLPAYRVVNLGWISAPIRQQLQKMKEIGIQPGDIAVWYDGVMDAQDAVSNARSRRPFCATYQRLALAQLLCHAIPLDIDAVVLGREYRATVQQGAEYAVSRGAAFYHFLQPHIWSKSLSSYEQTVVAPSLTTPEVDQAVAAMWPEYARAARTVNLTHVLDDARAAGAELYLDYDHVTERGNELIARAIYDQLTIY